MKLNMFAEYEYGHEKAIVKYVYQSVEYLQNNAEVSIKLFNT